jgi:hypothetical protein
VLNVEDISALVSRMWLLHVKEMGKFDRIHGYISGDLGRPSLPTDADEEIKAIRDMCVKNVLTVVRDTFAQNLSVVGYRRATSRQNLPGWELWQRNRMDARQAEIYRPALTYGVGYVTVTPSDDGPVFRPRSPRQLIAVYDDPQVDEWPQYALETWIDYTDAKPRRKAMLFDDQFIYPCDLGEAPSPTLETDEQLTRMVTNIRAEGVSAPIRHKAGVCPVIRYVNGRDSEDLIVGEVEPLIELQRAINEVNFDRLIVARFGAFPQKVIVGWSGSKSEVVKASARNTWTFEDDTVKASTLSAATTTPYNEILDEMIDQVALVAQISPVHAKGKMANLSADALAAAESNQQRKLQSKRDSFGEAHEQLFRVGSAMNGDTQTAEDTEAEVVWRDTEARSFAAVVDGIVKLATLDPSLLEPLLPMIPGLSQQQIVAVQEARRASNVTNILTALQNVKPGAPDGGVGAGTPVPPQPGQPASPDAA